MKNIICIAVFVLCISNTKGQNPFKLNQFPPLKFENNIPFNFQESNVFKLAPNSVDDLSSISPTLRIHMFGSMPNLVPLNFNQCKILVYYPTQNMMNTTNHMPNALKQNSMLCY